MKRQHFPAVAALSALLALALMAVGCGGENDRQATPPIVPPEMSAPGSNGQVEVSVFFMRGETPTAVRRPAEVGGSQQALVLLLSGLTDEEAGEGLSTAIPEGTTLNSYGVDGSTAKADFSGELKQYGGGSARVLAITEQIEKTVMSNDPGVKAVEITVDGVSSEEALQP